MLNHDQIIVVLTANDIWARHYAHWIHTVVRFRVWYAIKNLIPVYHDRNVRGLDAASFRPRHSLPTRNEHTLADDAFKTIADLRKAGLVKIVHIDDEPFYAVTDLCKQVAATLKTIDAIKRDTRRAEADKLCESITIEVDGEAIAYQLSDLQRQLQLPENQSANMQTILNQTILNQTAHLKALEPRSARLEQFIADLEKPE